MANGRRFPVPRAMDPLDEITLPALALAEKIKQGERGSRPSERLLAAAVLVLLAERESMAWLLREMKREREDAREWADAVAAEAEPVVVERARGYLHLRNGDLHKLPVPEVTL